MKDRRKKFINKYFPGEKNYTKGNLLRLLRKAAGINQVKLGKKTRTRQSNISSMEIGDRPIGKMMAERFAEVFGVTYLLFVDEE